MADEMTPTVDIHNSDPLAMAMAMQRGTGGGGDGLFGGGGLIGGLVLGSLLRNNGGLLGGDGAGGAVSAQSQANMSLMAGIGDLKQSVAVGTAQMEASQTAQTAQLSSQLSSVASALTGTVTNGLLGVRDAVNASAVLTMQGTNQVMQAVNADGEKTRALIVQQYEATLNRQLSEANAALVELRSEGRMRDNSITITQNVAQQQQQQQQQQQWAAMLATMNALMVQNNRQAQDIVNLGTMTGSALQTATSTQVR